MKFRRRNGGVFIALVLAGMALALHNSPAQAADKNAPQKWALLIGVDRYADSGRINDLTSSERDAQAIKAALIEAGGFPAGNITLLTTGDSGADAARQPTRGTILRELAALSRRVQPGDTVFVCFSGHGMEIGGKPYLLPSDADAVDNDTLADTSIEAEKFRDRLKQVPAGLLIVAFDMCRVAPLRAGRDGVAPTPTLTLRQMRGMDFAQSAAPTAPPTAPKAVVTLFSCSENQRSFEWLEKRRSYFLYFLEEGLRGKAAGPDGVVRLDGLLDYLRQSVPAAVRATAKQEQTPRVEIAGTIGVGRTALAGGSAASVAANTPASKPVPGTAGVTDTRARLQLTLRPSKAIVLVDGVRRNANPVVIDVGDAKEKSVEVGVSADGYAPLVQSVTLTRGAVTPLIVTLTKKPRVPMRRLVAVGDSLSADWRTAAEERIRYYRKGGIVITVRDANGKPAPGATITLTQKRSAFRFGTVLDVRAIIDVVYSPADCQKYKATVKRLFNYATVPFGWPWTDINANQKVVNWCRENNLLICGHCLFNGSSGNLPKDLADRKEPDSLRPATEAYIRDLATRFKGRVTRWNATEEITVADRLDASGRDTVWKTYQWVREIDPTVELANNDFLPSMGENDQQINARVEDVKKVIRNIQSQNAPITGIGIEAWAGWEQNPNFMPAPRLLGMWDRFTDLDLPIEISEFLAFTPDDVKQAAQLADTLTAAFSHPRIGGFTLWGFWEGAIYNPQWNGAIFRKDWTPRPAADVLERKILSEWRTNETGTTDEDGQFETRGFLGKYEVIITRNGRTVKQTLDVTRAADEITTLEVTL